MKTLSDVFRPFVLFPLLLLTPSFQAQGKSPSAMSPQTPYSGQLSRATKFRVDFRVAVTPPPETKQLKIWVPLPPSDNIQQITDRRLSVFPSGVEPTIQAEPVFGNRFAYFEIESPVGAQLISHQFSAVVQQVDWQVDYASVASPEHWPSSFQPYQRPDPRTQEGDQLRAVMDEISTMSSGGGSTKQLVNAMRWVDQNLTYDHVVASLTADPMHGLVHHRGHCSDYHGLCGTLARKIGFPSRVVYGLQMFDKASPSHCKLEVFLPPYGWVCYDLSETQKLVIKTEQNETLTPQQKEARVNEIRNRTTNGFRENTWLLVTRGTNYELAPPASRKQPLVRTIYAEADGQSLPDPDPSSPDQKVQSWTTMYRVNGDDSAKRFQTLD